MHLGSRLINLDRFCFVEFEDRRDAEEALSSFNGKTVDGRRIRCDFDIGLEKKEEFKDPRGYDLIGDDV